jgi:hypothetical protein
MGGSLYLAAQQTMQGLLKKLCRDHYFDFLLRDRLQQQIARQKHHQPSFDYDTRSCVHAEDLKIMISTTRSGSFPRFEIFIGPPLATR